MSASSAALVSASSAAPAIHVLNRLSFGPRPGDVDAIQRIGVAAWIDRQLHPERIDDGLLEARLSAFETLKLDAGTLFREYHQPAQLERRQQLRDGSTEPGAPSSSAGARPPGLELPRSRAVSDTQQRDRQIITELEEARILRAVFSERQLEEVLVDFWFNHFNVFAGKGPIRTYVTAFERDAIRPHVLGSFRQMLEAVAKSPAMLFYLDNWQNTNPDADRPQRAQMAEASAPQRAQMAEASAPQRAQMAGASGPQRTQMAGASGPQRTQMGRRGRLGQPSRRGTAPGEGNAQAARQRAPRGLNENYARELLELHTLGVDGGYTQDDIVNVARAFTGWTMRPLQGPEFLFVPALHDRDEKVVLGRRITAGGIGDGLQVLDLLAAHPSTARFIATKLAQKFVADVPPPSLVERAARTFTQTNGDLREVTRAIVTSPEFQSADAYRAKVKTPFEFVASALRATGADVRTALPLARWLRDLGMPLYFCQPPTGYDETADTWVSSGALVARMNFALELGGNRLRGVVLPYDRSGGLDALRGRLLADVLGDEVSDATRATLDRASTAEQVVALAIGSPEFQRQ